MKSPADVAVPPQDAPPGLLVPIMIAVTGHRNAAQEEQLTAAVNRFFAEMERRYPSSPLYLLSGLAEGADRIAANAALARGVRLIAVLPLPTTEYERDFCSPESLAEFRQLLGRAQRVMVTASEAFGEVARTQHYARLGEFLVEHGDLLLALWDGKESGKIGGTADVVRLRLKGAPRLAGRSGSYLTRRNGDVYQVVTPRKDEPAGLAEAGALYLVSSDGRRRPTFAVEQDQVLSAIDRCNRDLLEQAIPSAASQDSRPHQPAQEWLSRFDPVDALAIKFQARTWRALTLMLLCSATALISFQLQSPFPQQAQWLFLGYIGWLLAAYGIYGWSKQQQLESRAFDYRALAEGLRIQIVWKQAGLNAVVADCYLSRQQDVLRWIRRALLNWEFCTETHGDAESVTAESLQQTLDSWIRGQIRFFSKSVLRQHGWHSWSLRVAHALIFAGFLVGLAQSKREFPQWLTLLASLFPIFAATLLVFAKTRAWSEQVRQYKNMLSLFETAEDQLQQMISAGDLRAGGELLRELGREALGENADWLILHRSRPIKTPTGG